MKSNGSWLSTLNPACKLIVHILVMAALMAIRDPLLTLSIWLVAVGIGVTIGGWTPFYLLRRLLPYTLFFVLVCWMLAAFGKGEHVLWQWAWFRVTSESLNNGLLIGLRMLGFVTYGMLFTSTTDLNRLMMSLIHQLHVSPKWAYGMLAGFRFIPLFQSELQQMKVAHRIRGYRHAHGGKAFLRYALPLFSQGVRKSERIAIAMEARGFTGTRERTYYVHPVLTRRDAVYALVLLGATALLIVWL